MQAPFAIFSLPRSRSAWLKHWLEKVSGDTVGHDTAIEADTVDGWLTSLLALRGTCETGAVEAWPILRRAIPGCRIVTVHRPLRDVIEALKRLWLTVPVDVLARRAEALDDLAGQPGVMSVEFDALRDPRTCAAIQRHCLGTDFDWPAWEYFDRLNVQIDLKPRMARLDERRIALGIIKAEMIARLAAPREFVTVTEEQWRDAAGECEALGVAHHAEATKGIEGPYQLNHDVFTRMADAGLFRLFCARVDGALAGYCMWTQEFSAEAAMPPTMKQGPYYVAADHARHHLGRRLLDASREAFTADGVVFLRLHHTAHGRGARAGRLYEAMGAVEYQREYLLRIGKSHG